MTHLLVDEILELDEFIKESEERDLTGLQIGILIKQRINSIKTEYNVLITNPSLSAEELATTFQEAITAITTLLNRRLLNDGLERYELDVMRLFFINSLIQLWGEAGELKVLGSASLLAELLSTITPIDPKDILVPIDNPQYTFRRAVVINFLTAYTQMYLNAMYVVTPLHVDYLKEWAVNAFAYVDLMIETLQELWIPRELTNYYRTKKLGTRFEVWATLIESIPQLALLMVQIYPRITLLPDLPSIKSKHVDFKNLTTYLKSTLQIIEMGFNYISHLNQLFDEGFFTLNENPMQHEEIRRIDAALEFSRIVILGIDELDAIINKTRDIEVENLRSTYNFFYNYLLEYLDGNREEVTSGQIGENLAFMLEFLLFYAAVYAIHDQDYEIFDKVDRIMHQFVKPQITRRYPFLFGLYYTAIITIYTELNAQEKLFEIASKLEGISQITKYNNYNQLSFYILANLVKAKLGADLEQVISAIEAKFLRLNSTMSATLNGEITDYLRDLKRVLEGGSAEFATVRMVQKTPLDHFSVLIPRLENIKGADKQRNLVYLPFNLVRDTITDD